MDDKEARQAAFLERLWAFQAEDGLTDSSLAKLIGVDPSLVCRTRQSNTCGTRFILGAIDVYPELAFLLSPELPKLIAPVTEVKAEEGIAS